MSIWYLVRGEPLLVQGEVDATRLDIAARVDGRLAEIPVERGHESARAEAVGEQSAEAADAKIEKTGQRERN